MKGRNHLELIVAELSSHLSEMQLLCLLDYMATISTSTHDANYTVSDAVAMVKLVIGESAYETARESWSMRNQSLLKIVGKQYYKHTTSGKITLTIDPADANNYEIVYL